MIKLCAPAIIYLIFSFTQILIDIFNGMYNTAFIKIIVSSMVTLLLNILCAQGMSVVSWIIVFIPFILMTVIVSVILYLFGLNSSTGTSTQLSTTCSSISSIDPSGNIIIYDPEYNATVNPVYYKYPNIIVPNPSANDLRAPTGSSSPEYQS